MIRLRYFDANRAMRHLYGSDPEPPPSSEELWINDGLIETIEPCLNAERVIVKFQRARMIEIFAKKGHESKVAEEIATSAHLGEIAMLDYTLHFQPKQ